MYHPPHGKDSTFTWEEPKRFFLLPYLPTIGILHSLFFLVQRLKEQIKELKDRMAGEGDGYEEEGEDYEEEGDE